MPIPVEDWRHTAVRMLWLIVMAGAAGTLLGGSVAMGLCTMVYVLHR